MAGGGVSVVYARALVMRIGIITGAAGFLPGSKSDADEDPPAESHGGEGENARLVTRGGAADAA